MLNGLWRPVPGSRLEAEQGFVLPRPLRKPVRFLARYCRGEIQPPRYTNAAMTAFLFAATGIYGTYLGGFMPDVAQAVTARTGFAVDEINVTGNREVSEIDVLDRLELTGWTSLIGFDASAARDRITKLPWVENASVRKIYPDTIEVKLDERKPFAIWQHDGQLSVIERSGNIIASYNDGTRSPLPLLLGLGAPEVGANFVSSMQDHPDIATRVRAYIRVADRRWDLKLDNGVDVMLPETSVDEALDRLDKMSREQKIFDRDIVSIDLRLADRAVFALTDEAMIRRETELKEQAAANRKKKPETRT
ncbi:cell division protein FtsQ/DivIB [Mesorhizobium denitrificans]|uniref:Cell division protein FtsQ n=1 Tax=Mesorhizobium denitrificans TaxID=2294114 RepID=A0A371XG65_9HYPH|nr:cell division protein FtsQ/DivIB [Mesorhizobium denitrificans]RFC68216.1 cell division protein FtsQ/DivIB [Mesorhizobium denitrificans]